MHGSATHPHLASAAGETLDEIRRLQAASPEHLRPLFAYLLEHLCDTELSASEAWAQCPLPGRRGRRQFRELTGMDLRDFVQHCRIEVGRRLLTESSLPIHRIAETLGYTNLASFSRAFSRKTGRCPSSLRQAVVSQDLPGGAPGTPDLLAKALNRVLAPAEVATLTRQLVEIYPQAGGPEGSAAEEAGRGCAPEEIEKAKAVALWRAIAEKPLEEQLAALLRVRFTTTALFELLSQQSREAGRAGREKGVPIAELALFSLRCLDPLVVPSEARQALEARAWAWLGSAHCLAQDLCAAESALAMAQRLVTDRPSQAFARGEVLLQQGKLRWCQRRLGEALDALSQAVEVLQAVEAPTALGQALALRASVLYTLGQPEVGIQDLLQAETLAAQVGDDYLQFSILQDLAVNLVASERAPEAERLLPRIRDLCRKVRTSEGSLHVRWLEGLVALGRNRPAQAEQFLREARDGFLAIGSHAHVTLIGLDLATALLRLGKSQDCLAIAAESSHLSESLSYSSEALIALGLLRESLEQGSLSETLLRDIRKQLGSSRRPA